MFTPLVLAALAVSGLQSTIASQSPFLRPASDEVSLRFAHEQYDAGLFSPPFSSLSAVPEMEWGILSHPLFPKYSVRLKKSSFCDDTVRYAFLLYPYSRILIK